MKIKIKKIDYLPARQVTFSKRRRGIFKKAGELSILCESEVAVIIFSQTGKLFDFSSSSTKDVIARYNSHIGGEKSDQPTIHQLQLEKENNIRLRKELEDKSCKLRQMKGVDLEDLDLDELQKLEKLVEASLGRVIQTKGAELIEANNQLSHRMVMYPRGDIGPEAILELENLNNIGEESMTSESTTNVTTCSNSSLSLEDDCSDILSLKLGLIHISMIRSNFIYITI
ncbi:MADS-box protein AGL24-like isoform X2 [Malus sylvestris]|uniref:MADS-box protein AGL24-like isoform X2 n=1 Tax=Malus sylvestris TaxID=3752 RepID=UPI0021AC2FD4|nr:MADS-box protein AGL24-like isoform X2 [Malus sylvestris]